jgi:hypothetical protein
MAKFSQSNQFWLGVIGCLTSIAGPALGQSTQAPNNDGGRPIFGQPQPVDSRDFRARYGDEGSFRLRAGTTVTLAELPASAVNATGAPFWLQVCRTNQGQGTATFVFADGVELFSFSQARCVFIGFKQSVAIRLGPNDTADMTTQFLGQQ